MAVDKINITSPVGRFVSGSLYKARDRDFDGKPLVTKTGKNAGQPRVDYFIGLAIPKAGEQHWSQTEWGQKIWALGHQAFPQAAQRPDFSWKIEDGDSREPNKRNAIPAEKEGWAECWILKFSGGFAPKIYFQDGNNWVQNMQPDAVKTGYYLQVAFSVDDNGQQNNPGVYLNHQMVAFRGYGPEINFGPNVEDAGFGAAALPAGASMVPLATSLPAAAAAPPPGGTYPPPPAPGAYAAPIAAAAAPPPVPVYPNPGFVAGPPPGSPYAQPPAPPAAYLPPPNPIAPAATGAGAYLPGAGVAPPAPAPAFLSNQPQMTPKAGSVSYRAYRAAGWTEGQLIAAGLMIG